MPVCREGHESPAGSRFCPECGAPLEVTSELHTIAEVPSAAAESVVSPVAYGWYPDPTGRFDYRFWDGNQWTDSVSRGGVTNTDPLPESAPAGAVGAGDGPRDQPLPGTLEGAAQPGQQGAIGGSRRERRGSSSKRLAWSLGGVAALVVVLLIVVVVALSSSDSDDGKTSLTADERPTSTTEATTPTTSARSAGSADPTKILVGTRPLDFAAAPNGELAVVASGPPDQSGSTPIVISNATDEDLTGVSVAGTARDASGLVVASGESQGVEPETLPNGGVAIAYVYWGGSPPPAGSTLKFEASGDPSEGDDYQAVLEVTELNRVVANRFGMRAPSSSVRCVTHDRER